MVITSQAILYLLLFLVSINFFNLFYVLFLVFALCAFFEISSQDRISASARRRMCVLVLFAVLYLVAHYVHFDINLPKVVVIASFPCFFYIGSKWKRLPEECVKSILVIMAGTGIHCLLNLAKNFSAVMSGTARNTVDFWLNTEWVITGQISLFILLAGASFFLMFGLKFADHPFLKSFFLVLLLGGLFYNLQLGNRTTVYATALSVLVGVLTNGAFRRKKTQSFLKYVLFVSIIVFVIALAYKIDLFGFASWFEKTSFFRRHEMNIDANENDMSSRSGQITAAFSQLFSVPWGGNQMYFKGEDVEFVHNAWLNVAFTHGLLPALLFFIFSLLLVAQCIRLFKANIDEKQKILFAGMYIAILCYFFLEPVCEAAPAIVSLLCFISGTVEQMLSSGSLIRKVEL